MKIKKNINLNINLKFRNNKSLNQIINSGNKTNPSLQVYVKNLSKLKIQGQNSPRIYQI